MGFPLDTTVTLALKERAQQRATACSKRFRMEHTALLRFSHFWGSSEPIEGMITAPGGAVCDCDHKL